MQIVVNEQLKEAFEWTCKYAKEYKVDIDIQINAGGEVSVSVCPTYRDTAEAEPVRHGRWEEREADAEHWQSAKCSVCGRYHTTPYMYSFKDYNYCPNCGARMDEE